MILHHGPTQYTLTLSDTILRHFGTLMEKSISRDLMRITSCMVTTTWVSGATCKLTKTHSPGIQQAEANLETGEVGDWITLWNGTGGLVSIRYSLGTLQS